MITRDEYDAIPAVNWSMLKMMGRSPLHYQHSLKRAWPDTAAKKLGRAVHMAVLEPKRFMSAIAIWDGAIRRGQVWDAFKAANAGKEWLTEDELNGCMSLQSAVRADPHARRYLDAGEGETAVTWTHVVKADDRTPETNIPCKGLLDFVSTSKSAILDLKTTRIGSPSGFAGESWKYRYHAQAAMYVDGYAAKHGTVLPYVLIVVEKESPFVVQVYTIPDHILALGREEYQHHLRDLAYCRSVSRWPGYVDGESELSLPHWMLEEEEDISGLDLILPAREG